MMRSGDLVLLCALCALCAPGALWACGSSPSDAADAGDTDGTPADAGGGAAGDGDGDAAEADAGAAAVPDAGGGSNVSNVSNVAELGPPAEPGGNAGCGMAFEPGDSMQLLHPNNPRASRTYLLHVPPGYDGEPTPLVLNLHGFVNDGADQRDISGMGAVADAEGFIVAYPNGLGMLSAWNAGDCCAFGDTERDDLTFLDQVIDHIAAQLCVDRDRVYSTGYSNGGFMGYKLACERSTTYAAIGSVAGVFGILPEDCQPERIVPFLHLHGTADVVVPYEGGEPAGYSLLLRDTPPSFRSVADTTGIWREIASCGEPAVDFEEGDTRCELSDGCGEDGAPYRVCTITGGGHTWPGGDPAAISRAVGVLGPFLGSTSATLSASEEMWRFFEAHSL